MHSLPQVYWLGGAACAGKTTTAKVLAARLGIEVYHADDRFDDHRRRADPDEHPAFCALMNLDAAALAAPPPAEQARRLLAFYADELSMIVEDLLARDPRVPVLVDGVGVLPERVAPWLGTPPRGALWLDVPATVRRRRYRGRRALLEPWLRSCADPDAVLERWIERDQHVAEAVLGAVYARDLPVLVPPPGAPPERVAERVASLLALPRVSTPSSVAVFQGTGR